MSTVLVGEDDADLALMVRAVMSLGGHDVLLCATGEEVLARHDQAPVDLVVIDVQLAGDLDGLEVVRRLRASGTRTPVLAMSGHGTDADRSAALAAGADEFLPKPFDVARLEARTAALLGRG